jgi:hypothetical protein
MTTTKLSFYREDLTSVRGTFEDVATGDLIFGYGSWLSVTKIGRKYMTMVVDGHESVAKLYNDLSRHGKFDVKIAYLSC